MKQFVFIVLIIFSFQKTDAQDRFQVFSDTLERLAQQVTGLDEKINISVSEVPIQEFLRGIARSSKININVAPDMNFNVTNNFNDVKVRDILVFLCKQYDLDMKIIGNIINISKPAPVISTPPPPSINYDSVTDKLSLDIKNENLAIVAKKITMNTGKNIILAPRLESTSVSCYIKDKPFDNAMDKFAFANNLVMRKTPDGFYIIENNPVVNDTKQDQSSSQQYRYNSTLNSTPGQKIGKGTKDSFNISVLNAPVADIIKSLAAQFSLNLMFLSNVEGNFSLDASGLDFEQFLELVLDGTKYSYKKDAGIYLIAEVSNKQLREAKVIRLQNRTIDKIGDVIPAGLKENVEIKEFPDLNSLLVSGPMGKIRDLESFINQIDKVVPVILIEVMIIDINNTFTLTTGIEAGLSDKPVATSGKIFPELDMSLSSQSLNKIINSFKGFGSVNMGKVTENFYVTLKALEEQGLIDVRSTPKLSTLNGHEAKMSIGNTEYYQEEQSNVYGSLNSQLSTVHTYKNVEADLSVNIKPFVSGNEQITLEIEVEQSDFTKRISQYAPPGKVSRKFKSAIRVKNEEMVLLGGLDQIGTKDSGSGVPFLSRIPIIKWFFSSRTKADNKSKLNIFIKPTIIY